MFHVLIAEPIAVEGIELLKAASDITCSEVDGSDRAALLKAAREAQAIIIRSKTVIDREVVNAAPNLRIVARAGMGVDNVDVRSATAQGVMVMNLPNVQAAAAAEYTMGLMLAVVRHIPAADAAIRRGEWLHEQLLGCELNDKVLGIIGLGQVGRKVARLAQSFGMDVIAVDPYVPEEIARQHNLILVDMDELLSRADFVSIHVPPTQKTMNLISAAELAKMKAGTWLVNTSWGKIVDQDALIQALDSGHLAGAALDVFTEEPMIDERLRSHPKTVLTPRLGDRTAETFKEIGVLIAQQVIDALRETDFRNVVNMPFISASGYDHLRYYLKLAEAMGILQIGLSDGPIERIEVECIGESLWDQVRPITVALLKGVLEQSGVKDVNYINAPLIAHERGIALSQTQGLLPADYPNLIACRVLGEGWERVIAGTVFGGVELRIIQIGRFHTELKPAGIVLIIRSVDLPGVIGQIGTLLGKYEINIAAMDYGRILFGGDALSLLTVDDPVSEEVLRSLAAVEQIADVRQIIFEE